MGSAFLVTNYTKQDLWFVLRSSNQELAFLRLGHNKHKIIQMADGEIVTSQTFSSEEDAKNHIGIGERHKLVRWEDGA